MFAILLDVLLEESQEEIHHFVGWEGGLKGCEIVNKHFLNKLAFPTSADPHKESVCRPPQRIFLQPPQRTVFDNILPLDQPAANWFVVLRSVCITKNILRSFEVGLRKFRKFRKFTGNFRKFHKFTKFSTTVNSNPGRVVSPGNLLFNLRNLRKQ